MTTPVSVRYILGYLCREIDQLLCEDEEVFESKGHESLVTAKQNIIDAINEMTKVRDAWRGKK